MSKSKKKWKETIAEIRKQVELLRAVQDDVQADYDDLSETQQEGTKGESLMQVIDADVDGLESMLDDLEAVWE